MKKFEYRMLTINAHKLSNSKVQMEIDQKFNSWGRNGWELVKMEPITTGGLFYQGASTREFLVVFKREKTD